MTIRFFLALSCVLVLCSATSVHAQLSTILSASSSNRPLSLILTPEQPLPGDSVTARITSASLDLARSTVVWRVDGAAHSQGDALTEITVTAPAFGETLTIEVIAEGPEGEGRATARISPVEIQILWSTDSFVPLYYKGRRFPGSNASIKAYALTRFFSNAQTLIPEKDIVYTWYRNDQLIASVSGRGKSSARLPGPQLFSSDQIRVRAESIDKRLIGETTITIPALDTKLVLYEKHPLFGVLYHRAIVGEVHTIETEQQVTAVPYFASALSPLDPSLMYEWRVNDQNIIPDPAKPNTITITANGYRGPATINLAITSARDIVMNSLGTWTMQFGSSITNIPQAFFNE